MTHFHSHEEDEVGGNQPKKILVAAGPPIRDTIIKALQSPDLALTFCSSVEEATALLRYQQFDLIFCTIVFDSSRWADLLRDAKKNQATQSVPFIIIKITQGILSDRLVESSLKSAMLIGADAGINLAVWCKKLGEDKAYSKLRNVIHELISNGSLPPSWESLD